MKKYYSDETKNQKSRSSLTERVYKRYMLKPEYQGALYILGLNPKRKHSRKQKRLTSEIIMS